MKESDTTLPAGSASGRIQSMDILKFIAIFLVLWGHSEQYFLSGENVDNTLFRIIYSFHMPLFMAISGFFFAMTVKPGVWPNIISKGRRLILPALSWTLLAAFIPLVWAPGPLTLHEIGKSLASDFWFLKSAFACSLLGIGPLVILKRHFWAAVLITVLVSQALYFVPVVYLSRMYPAFITGVVIFRCRARFMDNLRWIVPLAGGIWVAGNFLLDGHAFRCVSGMEEGVSIWERICWILFFYALGLCGSVLFIGICELLFRKRRHGRLMKLFSSWGSLTLGIYILQVFLLENFLSGLLNFDSLPFWLFDFLIAPGISLAVMGVCVAFIRVIRSNPYASLLLLGDKLPPADKIRHN